jgi:hypothetical protein
MAEDWAEKILNYKYIEKEMECKIVTAIHNKTETETETNIETEGNELPKYFDIIKNLFIKYESSAYMRQRLSFHLTNILPSTLETEEKTHEKRVERTAFLTKEQQTFMQVFLSKNQYYYLPNNGNFYQYDGKTYKMVTEDDIQYQLLSTISKDRTLMDWKHKTKLNVIKQIKERNIFKSVPETDTIQKIINLLCPLMFSTKSQVKYFLSIIGDSILKKQNDLIFLTKPKTRKVLNELDHICYIVTGYANVTNNFITKYNETYNYQNCRLININDTISVENLRDIFNKNGLDFLCVATHYSERYGNSDQYLLSSDELSDYTLYLKNNNQLDVFNKFCSYSIENVLHEPDETVIKHSLSWKNVHFIWKLFISKNCLPSVIYSNNLKKLLKERYSYDEIADAFNNITSKHLPFVKHFIHFWENTITVCNGSDFDHEIEIDELCGLFKKWIHDNNDISYYAGNTNEHDILKILNHYFPNIEVSENKYILNVQCSMWNKNGDINNALSIFKNYYKENIILNESASLLISFDEMYAFYIKNKQTRFTISKRYFEKYLYFSLADYIEFDNFVSISWTSSS